MGMIDMNVQMLGVFSPMHNYLANVEKLIEEEKREDLKKALAPILDNMMKEQGGKVSICLTFFLHIDYHLINCWSRFRIVMRLVFLLFKA